MDDLASTDSPLEVAAGAAGPRAVEAFSILGNETRLSIMLALWEAYDPGAEDNAVLFSELRDRVGMSDSGRFNYHLDKLAGNFIRKTADGYELRRIGHQIVGTVIGGIGIEEPTFEPIELDEGADELAGPRYSFSSCFWCGAPNEIRYQDGALLLFCTECEGNFGEGRHGGGTFEGAGFIDRTPEQAFWAHFSRTQHITLSLVEGVCPRCAGPVDTSLEICEDHDSEGPCDNCGAVWPINFRSRCRVCKRSSGGPPNWMVGFHPDVVGFYSERGVQYQFASDGGFGPTVLDPENEQTVVSDDPLRVRITYEYEGDQLEVLIDEEMNVLEVTESD